MKLVIGIIGEIGSGKEMFVSLFSEIARKRFTVARVRFSEILRETLRLWDIPMTREHIQKIQQVMRGGFGEDVLPHAMQKRIQEADTDIVLLDGVRWEEDVNLIRSFPRNYMIYVTADPKVRYERTKMRSENIGDATITFKAFMEQQKAPNELLIAKLGARANMAISNNGTVDEFRANVNDFFEKSISVAIGNMHVQPADDLHA